MQDIQSIAGGHMFVGGGGGGGGGGTGDRRLRPNNHQLHQALKCPRCDSLNTKFCYYNNYNLSQPRHFCKNCRRYWTKGGVLRNVPVGGGCRKTKRSKPKSSAPAAEITTTMPAQAGDRKSSSNSSSESSSLTATTTAAAMEAVSAISSTTPLSFFNGSDYQSIIAQNANAAISNHEFEQGLLEQSSGGGIFSEIGNFASMISPSAEPPRFEFTTFLDENSHWSQNRNHEQKIHQSEENIPPSDGGAFINQTAPVDLPSLPSRTSGHEAFGQLDWQDAADTGLFDLSSAVDQSYWSRNTHWADEDHQPGLYLP